MPDEWDGTDWVYSATVEQPDAAGSKQSDFDECDGSMDEHSIAVLHE